MEESEWGEVVKMSKNIRLSVHAFLWRIFILHEPTDILFKENLSHATQTLTFREQNGRDTKRMRSKKSKVMALMRCFCLQAEKMSNWNKVVGRNKYLKNVSRERERNNFIAMLDVCVYMLMEVKGMRRQSQEKRTFKTHNLPDLMFSLWNSISINIIWDLKWSFIVIKWPSPGKELQNIKFWKFTLAHMRHIADAHSETIGSCKADI